MSHAAPATEPGEHRPGVPDHRRRRRRRTRATSRRGGRRRGRSPAAGGALGDVADEHRQRGAAARAPPWRSTSRGCGRRPAAGRRGGDGRRARPSGSSRAGSRAIGRRREPEPRPRTVPACRHGPRGVVPPRAAPTAPVDARWRRLGDRPSAAAPACPASRSGGCSAPGAGRDTGPSADPRRTALFAVWDDEAALDAFLAAGRASAGPQVAERYDVRLRAARRPRDVARRRRARRRSSRGDRPAGRSP